MWIIIYILTGILYSYMLDIKLCNNIIKSDNAMYLFLVVIDILVFIGIQLYYRFIKNLKVVKWHQLVIGTGISVIFLLGTISIRFIVSMRGM